MGATAQTLLGTIPRPGTVAFDAYLRDLRALRVARAPVLRGTVYYVDAAAGNDANAGTFAAPWATVAKANAAIAASILPELTVLFKRGATWRGATGIVVNRAGVSVGAYGTGAKPRFDRFVNNFADGTGWAKTAGRATTYEKALAAPGVAWLRAGAAVGGLTRAASVAEVDGAAPGGSPRWYWDAGAAKLYVSNGVDGGGAYQAGAAFAWVEPNGDSMLLVGAGGDLGRADNLQGDGWGMDPADANGLGYAIRVGVTGTNEYCVTNCDVRFSANHLIGAYNGGAGGVVTFVGNSAGYGMVGAGADGLYLIAYSALGGMECFYSDTTVVAGHAPTVGGAPAGGAAGGHTAGGGATFALLIYHATRVVAGPFQAAAPAGMTDTTEDTGFVVDDVLESSALSVGQVGGPIALTGCVVLRPRWQFRVATGEAGTVNFDTFPRTGLVIGGWITIDLTGWTPAGFQRVNLIARFAADYTARFVTTRFDVLGGAGGTFVFDLQAAFGNPVGERFEGCVFTFDALGGGTAPVFQLPILRRNAYYNVNPAEVAADAYAIFLSDPPPFPAYNTDAPSSPLYRNLPLPLATPGVSLETDFFGRRRNPFVTSIGPIGADDRPTVTGADVVATMNANPPAVNVVETNGEPLVPLSGGVGGEGSGDTPIDHDGGAGVTVDGVASVDGIMTVLDDDDQPIDDAEINAFRKVDWDAGVRNPNARQGWARTDVNGHWVGPINLNAGNYVLEFSGKGFESFTVEVVIP